MAARASFSDDSRMIKKTMPKSLLLRDYLLDDMSSCSSNGFRSYPRRQCCTAVRFPVEIDLNKNGKQKRSSIPQNKPKQSSSVLQRASALMINAFKHFPFAGGDRISSRKPNFLPRSLSRKLLKHGFWKKTDHNNEIKRLKSFGDLIREKEAVSPPPPPSSSPLKSSTAVAATTTTAELTNSTSNSNSYSWSDSSDFTTTTTTDSCFTTGSSSTSQNEVVNDLQEKKEMRNEKRVGATAMTTTCSSTTGNEKEKHQNDQVEQFSPVSVMDFPCDNDNDMDGEDEDEVSSIFQRRRPDVEGTKKMIHKTRRFEGVPPLEPVKLEDRMTRLALESTPAYHEFEQEDSQAEKKAIALLQLMESTFSHRFFKYEAVESLLLGFFKEKLLEENITDYEMLQTAREWMYNQIGELFLDWESEKNRQTYARSMEKGVKWSNYGQKAEIKDIGLELEHEVFTSLIDHILLDFHE